MTFHGTLEGGIEYYATVAGQDLGYKHFFDDASGADRFFFAGNEFSFKNDFITHKGSGGAFCKYMFGVDQPIKDLVRKDVINKLSMYGAQFSEGGNTLNFTRSTDGKIEYESIFRDGNAVDNFYFFCNTSMDGSIVDQQREILKLVGKTLKYSKAVGENTNSSIITELMADLDGYKPVIFLFRLVNPFNKRYYQLFKELYEEDKELNEDSERLLIALANEFSIDQYQQERIKLDVIYEHHENKRIIEEYKDLLISFEDKEKLDQADLAAIKRLKSLAMRKHIPHYLFDLIDEVLLDDEKLVEQSEPEYIHDSRMLLRGLFMMEGSLDEVMSKEDILKLMTNKKEAMENRDQSFDELLLDVGRVCDENFQQGDTLAFERFSELITIFDRYDTTSAAINHIAFMDDEVNTEKIRSIFGNREKFEAVTTGLFHELFIADLLSNQYLTFAGRNKINTIIEGLDGVEQGELSLSEVAKRLTNINREDRTYQLLYSEAKKRLKKAAGADGRDYWEDQFIKEVLKSLLKDKPINNITKELIKKVFTALKMEVFYVDTILPDILKSGEINLREDFINNSGLDRFFIEDIEREYIEKMAIPDMVVKGFRDLISKTENDTKVN